MAHYTNNFYLSVIRGNNPDLVRIIKESGFDKEKFDDEVEVFRYCQSRANSPLSQPNPTDADMRESADFAHRASYVKERISKMVYPLFEKMVECGYDAQQLRHQAL